MISREVTGWTPLSVVIICCFSTIPLCSQGQMHCFPKSFLKKEQESCGTENMKDVEEILAAPVDKCSMPNRGQGALVLHRAVCLCWAVLVCKPCDDLCPRKGCLFSGSRVLVLGKLWGKGTCCFCPSCREVPCLCARAFSKVQTTDPGTVNSSSKGCRVQSTLPLFKNT